MKYIINISEILQADVVVDASDESEAIQKVTDMYATAQYANDYGEMVNIPAPHIYLAAAAVGALIVIPLFFLAKEFKKQKAQ